MNLRCLLLVGLLGLCFLPRASAQVPTITNCDSTQYVCAVDSIQTACFRINIGADFTADIDRFEIYWGDGSDVQVVTPEEAEDPIYHTFDLTDFYLTCEPEKIYRVDLYTFTKDNRNEFNGSRIIFVNPPQAAFEPQENQGCQGKEVNLLSGACPSDVDISYDFGDGSSGTGNSHVYQDTGRYFIVQTASNVCGTSTMTREIDVIPPPQADADADSNITAVEDGKYFLCSDGGKVVTRAFVTDLDNVTSFKWNSSKGARITNSRYADTVLVRFDGPGTYTLTLSANNVCNNPFKKKLTFEVQSTNGLRMDPFPDDCKTVLYTPSPFDPDAEYTINGATISSFPIGLPPNSQPYVVVARLENKCGTQFAVDTVRIEAPEQVQITEPENMIRVCESSAIISLKGSIPGGTWRINGIKKDSLFNPSEFGQGTHVVSYEAGEPGCTTEDEIYIQVVPGPDLELGPDLDVCVDGPTVDLSANITGGVWSGSGVIDTINGTFDPAAAGPGRHRIRYTYYEASTKCTVESNKFITVVDIPGVGLIDTAQACLSTSVLNLEQLMLDSVSVGGGSLRWYGAGVTDNDRSEFYVEAAGGLGSYEIVVEYDVPPGCVSRDTAILELGPVVPASSMADTSLCINDGNLALSASPAGGRWYNDKGVRIDPLIEFAGMDPGVYTYEYVVGEGTTCESRSQTSITLVPSDVVNAGDDLWVCEGSSVVQLPSQPGTWEGPELTASHTISVENLAVGTNSYTLRDSNIPSSCNTDVMKLTVTPKPEIGFELDSAGCRGESISTINTTTGADRYTWDFGDGATSNTSNPSHVYGGTGRYTVRLTALTDHPVTGNVLCSEDSVQDIEVFETPLNAAFKPSAFDGCSPLTIDLNNQSQGNPLNYEWDLGDGTTFTEEDVKNLTLTANKYDTTYQVKLRVFNQCGERTVTRQIQVRALPTADFATELTRGYCSGEEVKIGHKSLADSLVWDFGNGETYSGFEPPKQVYKTGADNDTVQIKLVAFNGCGTDTMIQDLVIVPSTAKPAISVVDNRPCTGDTVFLRSLSRPREALVEWSFPDGSATNGSETYFIFEEPGKKEITATVFACGYDSTSIEFEVQAAPDLDLVVPGITCEGAPFEINLNTEEPITNIYLGDSLIANRSNFEFSIEESGTYEVRAKAETLQGCTVWETREVEIVPGPRADFTMTDSVCAGTPIRLTSTSSSDALTCSWLIGGEARFTDCKLQYSFEPEEPKTAQLTVTNDIGCRDSLLRTIFVYPSPRAAFDLEVLDNCTPAQIRLTNKSSNATGLNWVMSDGSRSSRDTVLYEARRPGEHTVFLSADNDNLCVDTAKQSFEVLPRPDMLVDTLANCTQALGYDLRLQAQPVSRWRVSGPDYDQGGNLHMALQPGNYLVTATSLAGCMQDTMIFIPQIGDLLIKKLTPDTVHIRLGETVQLGLETNRSDAEVQWSPAALLDNPVSFYPRVNTMRSVGFNALVTDRRGCAKEAEVYVKVDLDRDRGVYIPNTFTPDYSGHNDFFRVRLNTKSLKEMKVFRIFAPDGGILYEEYGCDPDNTTTCAWDGKLNGEAVRPGVYAYYVELEYIDGTIVTKKGSVHLLR